MRAVDLGHRLSEILSARGMSKLQFSVALQERRNERRSRGEPPLRKVDRPALYAFLDGRDVPPVDTLAEMADILEVRLGWLATGEEPMEVEVPPLPLPIWLVDGHRGPWKRPSVEKRLEARVAFQELFLGDSEGFWEAEPVVRLIFLDILARRLARRRSRGDRGPSDPAYRAQAAKSLYLKCFLDVKADLPQWVTFESPDFTSAFLDRVGSWLEDEEDRPRSSPDGMVDFYWG